MKTDEMREKAAWFSEAANGFPGQPEKPEVAAIHNLTSSLWLACAEICERLEARVPAATAAEGFANLLEEWREGYVVGEVKGPLVKGFLELEDESGSRILIAVDSVDEVWATGTGVRVCRNIEPRTLECTTSFDEVRRRLEVKGPVV